MKFKFHKSKITILAAAAALILIAGFFGMAKPVRAPQIGPAHGL